MRDFVPGSKPIVPQKVSWARSLLGNAAIFSETDAFLSPGSQGEQLFFGLFSLVVAESACLPETIQ